MAMIASIGTSQIFDGREAGSQAAHQALGKMNRLPASLALVMATHDYSLPQVTGGVASYLSEVPLLGFSTLGSFIANGDRANANAAAGGRRSVTVALLGGDLKARADWWPIPAEDSSASVQRKLTALQPTQMLQTASLNPMPAPPRTGSLSGHALIMALDGLSDNAGKVVAGLPEGKYTVLGCLASGAVSRGVTYQAGGRQTGAGGCAAALVSGGLSISTGYAHGWKRIGAFARITRARGLRLEELDDRPAVEIYARLFDYPAEAWSLPPLDEFVRLYPLGVDTPDGGLRILSPLRVEAGGALRMQTPPPQGAAVHLLAASSESCLAAAQSAASQALAALDGSSPPILALALVDAAWQLLLQTRPEAEFQAVRAVLGGDIPLIGGYTFGQIVRPEASAPAELLTQHILVALFAPR